MRTRLVSALVLLALVCAWPAMAQEQTGSIQGIVKDSSGGVLPGVTVEARNAAGAVQSAVTDEKGEYRFPALAPGRYEVTATLSGFQPAKVANVALGLGQLLKIDLPMSIATLQENVQVTAEAPLIDTKQNAAFATIQQEAIARIPKGRDFTSVITMAPGAQSESKAGGEAQVDGASGSENRFIIDGMDTTNLQNGISGKTMLVDFIQEVQVKSSGYNAEFGGATGGVVSAITKSGTNQFRGSLGVYEQSNALMGDRRRYHSYNPYTDQPEGSETIAGCGTKNLQCSTGKDLYGFRTPWQYWSPVGDFGGPILKDKLWFYAGMAFTSNFYKEDARFTTDVANGYALRHFEQTNYAYYPNLNLTAQLTNNLRVRVSGSDQYNRTRGALPTISPNNRIYYGTDKNLYGKDMGADFYSTSTFDKFSDGSINQAAYDRRWNLTGNDSRTDVISTNIDWVITPRFFINATGGYYRNNYWTPPDARGNDIVHVLQNAVSDTYMKSHGYPTLPSSFQQASGYADNISSSGYLRNIYDRIYGNVNAIYYKSLAGQHVVKAGSRFERFGNDIYNGNTKPRVNFYFGNSYTSLTDGKAYTGKYGYYMVNKTGTIGAVHSNNIALWLQDSWTVNNKLTINAGIRAENETVPSYKKTADAIDIKFGFKDKIAPRLGFAYDINGDSKWKVYGSFGYFYDITKLSLPRGAFGGDHWINYYWTLDTYDWTSVNCDEGTSGCPGQFIEQWDARRSSNQVDPDLSAYFHRPNMAGIDPALKPVQSGEFVLGGDHELSNTMSFGLRYVHKWLFRTIEDVGLLLPGIGEAYIIANPGFGYTEVMNPDYPSYKTPHAKRQYDAMEARLIKRFASRWFAEVDYTFSRLYGNYGGLASSDENGRTDPNINRYFDALYMSYDKNNKMVEGNLATDRPHVVKINAGYDLPWGTTIGAYALFESGTPMTEEFTFNGYPIYANGRGNLGRLPMRKLINLNAQHDFKLGGNRRLTLAVNADNIFDFKTTLNWYSVNKYRAGVSYDDAVFYGGPWDPAALVAKSRAGGSSILDTAWFATPDTFEGARQFRFQAKFSF